MSRHILTGLLCLTLSACGTIKSGGSQEITVETPGANDAVCYIDNNHIKYRLFTPGKVVVSKRPGDLTVMCLADGNRERTVVLKQETSKDAYGNILTAGLGAAWDYETGGLFDYPEKIVVDFTNIPAELMPVPNYHKHLMENPELGGMEEFRPGRSALIRDKYEQPYELQRRSSMPGQEEGAALSSVTESDGTTNRATVISTNDISATSTSSADILTRSMNPAVFGPSMPAANAGGFVGGTNTNTDGPVTLHPVQ